MNNSIQTVDGGTVWTRRIMLKTAGLGALSWALPDGLFKAAAAADIPIGVQLYSVRGDCQKDFDAALERVAQMGFAGVEFAGYYNYAERPVELSKRLEQLNLKVAGTHISTGLFHDDAIQGTIDFHQAIGCKFLIVPGDPGFTDPEKSKALADLFNKTATRLKSFGMACGFHNHTAEFNKDGDKTYWDLFAERTAGDVILQQDCGWTAAAGFNPVEYVRKYPGRTRSVHFKPTVIDIEKGNTERKAIIGQDSVDWAAVFAACSSVGGTEWVIVEQETYPDGKPAMECTALSLAGLKKIIGAR